MFARAICILFLAGTIPNASAADAIRSIRPDKTTGTSAAVVVDGAVNLVHTAQLLPVDADGRGIAAGKPEEQSSALLDRLESTLKDSGSDLDRLIKIDIYLARADVLDPFQRALARRLSGRSQPAVTYVVGALPAAAALVALDAIAVTSLAVARPDGRAAVLPVGPRVFVSGQAEPDTELVRATKKTLDGLDGTLKFLGLDRSRVVRLKAFMQPLTAESARAVEREVSAFFGGKAIPPLTLVEWRFSTRQPIEIELVAAGRDSGAAAVDYLTPPGLKPSPVFSRVARVAPGPLIYVSGLYGAADESATDQVEAAFATLTGVLTQAGSDLRHLVKATYYVVDGEASTALNELRPNYFEPSCPPAASKAFVLGVGLGGRTVTLDMIAVPAAR